MLRQKIFIIIKDQITFKIVLNHKNMLLKWQAAILNRIYETNLFDKIIIPAPSIENIDYRLPYELYQTINKNINANTPKSTEEFLDAAHLLCKSKLMEEKRDKIIFFNEVIKQINRDYENSEITFGFFHVIMFSSLSKCTIWPGMFKTSQKLVPTLIQFYSKFHKHFINFLQYKFDPLILSTKFNKIVKNIKQKKQANPQLFAAAKNNDLQTISKLTENNNSIINECIQEGLYLTHFAAIHSNLQTLRLLLSLKANFELLDLEEQTPIFYAVKRFDLGIVKFFVQEAKVNINHTEYQSRTPIYLAAFEGNLEIVDYLYSKGADPQIESKLARTPLSKACYLGNYKVAEYLIKIGVRLEAIDSKGRTALHNAAWGIEGGRQGKRRGHIKLYDSPECVQLLIKAGHKIDFEDYDKFTPLFSAISSHAERSLRLLVHHGANLKHKTVKNESPVFIAAKYGHLKILQMLIEEYQCEYMQENIEGFSPLDASFTLNEPECCYYLLDLYLGQGIKEIKLRSLLKCLMQYKRIKNCQYLVRWIRDEQKLQQKDLKIKYVASNIDCNIKEILDFIFSNNEIVMKRAFFKVVEEVQDHMLDSSIDLIFKSIEDHKFYTNQTIKIIVQQTKRGHKPCHLALNHKIHQNTVIDLLSIQSNLTNNMEEFYHTFIKLIQMKLTRVILHILRMSSTQSKKQNELDIVRFDKLDLIKLLFNRINDKISIVEFCRAYGYFDIHKIITAFYEEASQGKKIDFVHYQRPIIPKYQYKQIQIDEIKSFLFPIQKPKQVLNFHNLIQNYLSQKQRQIYQKIVQDALALKVNPIIVRTTKEFDKLKQAFQKNRIVGIDVEHYSSSDESFVCLIQISTIEDVFLLDRFNYIHQEIKVALQDLFKDGKIIKIFHSYDNDLKWLVEDYQIQEFHSIFDTARIYGLIENQKNQTPSLKYLAQKYLNINIKKEYQKSDWRIRPLFPEMIEYAGFDAKVLPFILLRMLEINQNKELSIDSLKFLETKRAIKSTFHKNQIIF